VSVITSRLLFFIASNFVDLVAVKHQVEIVKIQDIARDDVRSEIVSRARCRSYLENASDLEIGASGIRASLELIT